MPFLRIFLAFAVMNNTYCHIVCRISVRNARLQLCVRVEIWTKQIDAFLCFSRFSCFWQVCTQYTQFLFLFVAGNAASYWCFIVFINYLFDMRGILVFSVKRQRSPVLSIILFVHQTDWFDPCNVCN